MMLTAQELKALIGHLRDALPQLERLAEIDIAGAEQNVTRLKTEGPVLIGKYKEVAKQEAYREMSEEITAHRAKLRADHEAHQQDMQNERDRVAQLKAEQAQILADMQARSAQLKARLDQAAQLVG